jgi:large subunit ribosomal protein L21
MYAIIETGGKQYRVAQGQRFRVEKIKAEAGETVSLDSVRMVVDDSGVKAGEPTVDGATVQCRVLAHGRGEKIRVQKYKKRKNYRRRYGHRQDYTELLVEEISS